MSLRTFLLGRTRSFGFACTGLLHVLRSQRNAWLHLLATALVIAAALILGLPQLHWCALVLAIGLVWTAETLNTSLELLCDHLHPGADDAIGRVKDVAAAGVLLSAITAATVGLLVLGPALWTRLSP